LAAYQGAIECTKKERQLVFEHFANVRMRLSAHLEGTMNGTGSITPIAAGRSAAHWQETMVSFGFLSVALSIVTVSVLLLIGLQTRLTT
jgi:hypothetical protein